jgi:Cu(I)/Ag(I) efflux system membrane fusion protein
MITDKTNPPSDEAAGPETAPVEIAPRSGRLRQVLRAIQVRLRFVVVLAVAFLVVGLWGNLRNVWDTWRHRFVGSHSSRQSVSIDTEYFCPMCPGVISDWPAICPVCSMDLVRRKKGEGVLLPEGVVARMQLSPYRIQLAGIATSIVANRPLAREIIVAGRLVRLPSSESSGDRTTATTRAGDEQQRLALECPAAVSDLVLLAAGQPAQVTLDEIGGAAALAGRVEDVGAPGDADQLPGRRSAVVRIRLDDVAPWVRPGMYGTARVAVPLSETEPFASLRKSSKPESADGFAAVPETAVVDTGNRRVVFVETMPGMFDGVEVTLGPRCGDYYPVIKGLESGQKIATVGAFLIDAEARLSPDLAAAYFGAARTADPTTGTSAGPIAARAKPPAAKRSKKQAAAKLSAADEELVKQQKICPVTEADLNSMGGPIAVEVAGRRVFICCQGCEKALQADPQKFLAKLKE